MIGKPLSGAAIFGALYAFVYVVGSAIFGVVTEHVGDYQLLRFLLFTAIAAALAWLLFTGIRLYSKPLYHEYRHCRTECKSFVLRHRGMVAELLVPLIIFVLIAFFLAMTSKQLIPRPDIPNTTMATFLLCLGYPVFLLLDLGSWAIVASLFAQRK